MLFGTDKSIQSKSKAYSCVISCIDGTPLQRVKHTKYLGLLLYYSELSLKCYSNQTLVLVFFNNPEIVFLLL